MSRVASRLALVSVLIIVCGAATALPVHGSSDGDLPSRLESAVEDWQREFAAHAVSAAVRVPGRDFGWSGAAGDVRAGWPAGPDTQYRVGSATKTFTATLLLQLVDEAKLSLDDPLANWYPQYPGASQITVRNLLQHTSGIKEMQLDDALFLLLSVLQVYRMWSPDELIAWSASPLPLFSLRTGTWTDRRPDPPGTVWRYAQPNYILAGRIIEKVTGLSYAENLRTRIVEPLGLKHTLLPPSGDSPFLPGWSNLFGMFPVLLPTTVLPSYNAPFSAAWSAGGVVTTPDDLATFHEAVESGRLFSPQSVAAMHATVPTRPESPDSEQYGLGLSHNHVGEHETWGHDGAIPGFAALNRLEAACGVYVTIATNTDDDPSPKGGGPPPPESRRLTDLGARLLDIVDDAIGCAPGES